MDQLHTNADWMVAAQEGEIENEDRITKLHARLQGLFGAQFEILPAALCSLFVIFMSSSHAVKAAVSKYSFCLLSFSYHFSLDSEVMALSSTFPCFMSAPRVDHPAPGFGIGPGQARALPVLFSSAGGKAGLPPVTDVGARAG